jgi:hypothetical protein
MYVANLTNKVQDFQFTLPEHKKVLRIEIPMGEQRMIPVNLSTPQIESVLEQHGPYGLKPAGEVSNARDFTGLCFSLDKAVPRTIMERGLERNAVVLTAQGQEMRKMAGVAMAANIEAEAPGTLRNVELEVREDTKNTDVLVDDTVRVTREAQSDDNPRGRGSRRRR